MGYRDSPRVAPNMYHAALDLYPQRLPVEPKAGDHLMVSADMKDVGGVVYRRGDIVFLVAETDDEPYGMADPYYSNFMVETPYRTSVWSSVRLLLWERALVVVPGDVGAAGMVLQS